MHSVFGEFLNTAYAGASLKAGVLHPRTTVKCFVYLLNLWSDCWKHSALLQLHVMHAQSKYVSQTFICVCVAAIPPPKISR